MSISHLAQAEGYSGASHPGLNTEGSYHRMIFEDRHTLHSGKAFEDLVCNVLKKFCSTDKSRLVIRVLLQVDYQELKKIEEFINSIGGTLGYYPDQTPRNPKPFWYTTFSINRSDRNPDVKTIQTLREINKKYIAKVLNNMGDFTTHNSKRLHEFERKGFRLTRNIDSHELSQLWIPFGWSLDACQKILENSNSDNFVLGVREKNRNLVAVILYSHQPHEIDGGMIIQHGELTEATTEPNYRGNGIMGVLATALHVESLHTGKHNIYGEYRALGGHPSHTIQSIKFALESGVNFHTPSLMVNHVDIDDIGDPHNEHRIISGYGGTERQLKSFLLGSLDNEKISDRISQQYLDSLSQ